MTRAYATHKDPYAKRKYPLVSVAVTQELRNQIELEADKQGISVSAVARNILAQAFGLADK